MQAGYRNCVQKSGGSLTGGTFTWSWNRRLKNTPTLGDNSYDTVQILVENKKLSKLSKKGTGGGQKQD